MSLPEAAKVDIAPRTVGIATRHDSAVRHVCGTAVYVDDIREPEGTLHLAVGGAPVARGLLKNIDLAAVRAAPGVVAVLTAADIPGRNDASPVAGDDPIFAQATIEFHRQVVFAVVAATRDAARRAALLGKIEVEPERPLVTVDDALDAGSYILPDYTFEKGEPAAALAASPHRLSGTLRIGGQEHFYLEGQVALAVPGEDEMLVYSSTQHPSELQNIIAHMLKLPAAAVNVEVRRMGGAFGGKESQAAQWAAIAALAASVTGRPCKIRLDRDDDMSMTGKRHDFRADYTAGFDRDGRITAFDVSLASRCGYSADLSASINDRAMFHADNGYYLPAARIVTKRTKTHTVSNTAFRGFGGPQGMMAGERMIDDIAWTLGLDPLDVRKRNLYGEGRDVTPYGMQVTDNILPELVETLERTSDYRARRREIATFNADERGSQARHRAHAGQVRYFVHHQPSQSGGRAGARLSGRLRSSQSRRHRDGAGVVRQSRPGGGGGIRRRSRPREDHADLDRQGPQHVADRGLVRFRHEQHGGPGGRCDHQGSAGGIRRHKVRNRAGVGHVSRQPGLCRQSGAGICPTGEGSLPRPHFALVDRLLSHAENSLGCGARNRPSILLFRLWDGLLRGDHRHLDRRDEGCACRHSS